VTHDDAFLQEVIEHPDDDGPRLVYADYLEEHGDPDRAELIRVCEAMRRTPVFAADYWRLKARRNELRPSCPAGWLAATGYDGTRYDPLFRDGFPDDWKGRWRLIREFAERWHFLPLGDVGGRRDEVRAEEGRLGLRLPPSLREFVAYAHDVAPAAGFGDVHRDVYTMRPLDGHPALSVLGDGDGSVRWAVHNDDLRLPDPPVYAYHQAYDDATRLVPAGGGGPEAPTLTDFVLGYVGTYKPARDQFLTRVRADSGLRSRLEAAFPFRVEGPGGTTYEGAGVLATLGPDRWGPADLLAVCVHRSAGWERVPAFLWEYVRNDSDQAGMFLTVANRQRFREIWGDQPPPAWFTDVPPPLRDPPAS
jgi:uncharacterized protein (TIGR02996 family)